MSRRRFKAVCALGEDGLTRTSQRPCARGEGVEMGRPMAANMPSSRRGGTAATPIQSPRMPPGRRRRPSSRTNSSWWRRSDRSGEPRRRVVRVSRWSGRSRWLAGARGGEGQRPLRIRRPIGPRRLRRPRGHDCTVARGEAWQRGCHLAPLRRSPKTHRWRNGLGKP